MSASAESNFLFALIAYQNGYITMEQFFEAAQAWNKNPKQDIGDIFVDRHFLEDVERYNIQGIVEDRVRRQGGIDKTLSFIIENGQAPDDPNLPESWKNKLEAIAKGNGEKDRLTPPKFDSAQPRSGIQRYIIRKTLGYGGQGYVWEAIDTELNRRVAIKNIIPKLSSNPLHQELLIEEARKTGKLGHPGIPPVFDIGKDDEGKPFFTMQLIQGEKLSEQYKNLRYESISRGDFVQQIRPLLRHLIAACNTVQFAFDKEGVIHRDLKPSNIMVNRYGETIVMDWGLGKVIDGPSDLPNDASSVLFLPLSSGSGSSERTTAGTIKGSVTFMSPEQARGENDCLDHRTDVYGLGAILYWILTGHPPHKATWEGLADIKINRFATPSQARPTLSIPKELEAICLKAMASAREDRYQKSGQFAEDIENFIAGEPVVALPDNTLRSCERFLRKHSRGVVASILGLSLAILGLSFANVIISRQRSELADANLKLQKQKQEIESEKEKTKDSRDVASDALDSVVGYLTDDGLATTPGTLTTRLNILKSAGMVVEGYIQGYPDDEKLKLDLVRILTRHAKLLGDNQQIQEANLLWQRADELLNGTKDSADNEFQMQWKKSFCDKNYFHTSALLKQGLVAQADAILDQTIVVASELMSKVRNKSDYAYAYARLLRRKTEVLERQQNMVGALENSININQVLDPLVSGHLLKMQSEPDSDQLIEDLSHGTLGYFILILGEQGDYETVLGKYADAMKSYQRSLEVCKLAPRVVNAKRDGIIQTFNQLRKLQRLAFLTKEYPKADEYYKAARDLRTENRDDPIVERVWLLIESDRARGMAATNLEVAEAALKNAQESFELFKNSDMAEFVAYRANKSAYGELEYSIQAASNAVAKKRGEPGDDQSLELLVKQLSDTQANPLLLKELRYLPQ